MHITEDILQTINSTNPLLIIEDKEFNEALLKFGSFLCIINNRKINQTSLMIILLENSACREIFKLMCGMEDDRILYMKMISSSPIICKSKTVKNKIDELRETKEKNEVKRKKHIQQVSRAIKKSTRKTI